MAALYTYPTMVCTFLSALIVARFSLYSRIRFGYIFFLPCLISIPLLDLLLHHNMVSENTGFALTMMVVVLVGIGCGGQSCSLFITTHPDLNTHLSLLIVQQASLYGLTGMFPIEHTQALMTGEGKMAPLSSWISFFLLLLLLLLLILLILLIFFLLKGLLVCWCQSTEL